MKFVHIALGIAISAGIADALSPEAKSVPERVVSVGYPKYGAQIYPLRASR